MRATETETGRTRDTLAVAKLATEEEARPREAVARGGVDFLVDFMADFLVDFLADFLADFLFGEVLYKTSHFSPTSSPPCFSVCFLNPSLQPPREQKFTNKSACRTRPLKT